MLSNLNARTLKTKPKVRLPVSPMKIFFVLDKLYLANADKEPIIIIQIPIKNMDLITKKKKQKKDEIQIPFKAALPSIPSIKLKAFITPTIKIIDKIIERNNGNS